MNTLQFKRTFPNGAVLKGTMDFNGALRLLFIGVGGPKERSAMLSELCKAHNAETAREKEVAAAKARSGELPV